MSLEPVKVFQDLSNKIAATKAHFEEYSAGVSKLLKLKDEILHKAVSRKPLNRQQLTNITVISSSLFLSKAAIEEQLASVNTLAGSSVDQARELPSRALLHWTLMAIKLLKRSHVSEHLQIRYRTARMLEIWDLAASSIPASPVPTPRLSISKQSKKSSKQPAAAAAMAQAPSPPPAARPSSPPGRGSTAELAGKLTVSQALVGVSTGQFGQTVPNVAPRGPSNPADLTGLAGSLGVASQPDLTFTMLPTSNAAERSPDGTASANAAVVQPAASTLTSMRQRDTPLLQINPAQLSRSSSHIIAGPRDTQFGAVLSQAPESNSGSISQALISGSQADNVLSGLSFPSASGLAADTNSAVGNGMAAVGSSGSDTAAALHGIKPQGSGTHDLLAAVNAVVGGLILRHTASLSGGAALTPIAEQSEADSGTVSGAPMFRQQQSERVKAAVATPDIFLGMAAAGFRRTRSNLRTGGSLTASTAADLPRAASMSSNALGQLSHQTSREMQQTANGQQGEANCLISGLSGGTMNTDEVDWRS
ncbi:hypothetical protein WJX77_008895 [Trebouxia sp. C0004]